MAKGRKKTVKWVDTGKRAEGLGVFSGKVRVSKDSEPIEFTFSAPVDLATAAKSTDASNWLQLLTLGAYTLAGRAIRVANDTTVMWKGKRTDAMSLKPGTLARFLTAGYQSAMDLGKKIPDKVVAIAAKAIAAKLITKSESVDADGNNIVTFSPVKVAHN